MVDFVFSQGKAGDVKLLQTFLSFFEMLHLDTFVAVSHLHFVPNNVEFGCNMLNQFRMIPFHEFLILFTTTSSFLACPCRKLNSSNVEFDTYFTFNKYLVYFTSDRMSLFFQETSSALAA